MVLSANGYYEFRVFNIFEICKVFVVRDNRTLRLENYLLGLPREWAEYSNIEEHFLFFFHPGSKYVANFKLQL